MQKKARADLSNAEARKVIAEDLEAFLASGKKIQKIPTGVSGQDALASRRHIVLSHGKKKSNG